MTTSEAIASARRLAENYRNAPHKLGERAPAQRALEAAGDWVGLARYKSQIYPTNIVVVSVQPEDGRLMTYIYDSAKAAFEALRAMPDARHYVARHGIVLIQPKDGAQ